MRIVEVFPDLYVREDGYVMRTGKTRHYRDIWRRGTLHNYGYYSISYNKKAYKVHRLILQAFKGYNKLEVDHINGDKGDNRLDNLRYVTRRTNQGNRKCHREGKMVGYYYDKTRNKYRAKIKIGYKNKMLGQFNTPEEANLAYIKAYEEIEQRSI